MIDLSFEGVSKRYLVRHEADEDVTLHPWVRKLKALRQPREEFWALRDVSFAVERGQTLGIIGHNGAGKSTMLKLLASITSPTTGRISINGRLSALIEVGSGFHPELTGRENIFLNGAILGMRRKEIAAKLDSIVEFAGVRQFLDVPVKRFSSGMYVRLGFSIAAHLDPDILLLDEVLAVGDAAFQEKCLARIEELKRAGTTIVFISHDLGAVERICDRVILMRRGQIEADDSPSVSIATYRHHVDETPSVPFAYSARPDAMIGDVQFCTETGQVVTESQTGAFLMIRVQVDAAAEVRDATIDLIVATPDRRVVTQLTTAFGNALCLPSGRSELTFICEELALSPGLYFVDASVSEHGAPEIMHARYRAAALRVDPGRVVRGEFYQPHSWHLSPSGPASAAEDLAAHASITSAISCD